MMFVVLTTIDQIPQQMSKDFIKFHGVDEELLVSFPWTKSVPEYLSHGNLDDFHQFLLQWSDACL